MPLWLTIVVMGLITYALRLALMGLLAHAAVPVGLQRALRFVPPAVLAAIIAPELLRPGGQLDLTPGNTRLLAGTLAAVIAWRTRNVVATIAAGMLALWLLEALLK